MSGLEFVHAYRTVSSIEVYCPECDKDVYLRSFHEDFGGDIGEMVRQQGWMIYKLRRMFTRPQDLVCPICQSRFWVRIIEESETEEERRAKRELEGGGLRAA
jgi:endogenous inhibitor of DNA gyrase (YacG/DUF329 family)